MDFYDLLKIISVTKSSKLRVKELLASQYLFHDTDLATLCSFYSSLHGLEFVFEDYFTKNSDKLNKKVEDREFLEEMLVYIKICTNLEGMVNSFVSTEVN